MDFRYAFFLITLYIAYTSIDTFFQIINYILVLFTLIIGSISFAIFWKLKGFSEERRNAVLSYMLEIITHAISGALVKDHFILLYHMICD